MLDQNASMDVSAERFEALVVDALDAIPEDLGTEMENVAVFIEEWPTPAQLDGRRGTLFGLYEGISLTRRSPINYSGALPDRITIFRGPITRAALDEEQLREMVTTTVVHEIAHHFGISDARLHELGWG